MMKKMMLGAGLVLAAGASFATNVGTIDMEKVIASVPQVKVIKKNMEDKFKPKRAEMVKLQKSFQAAEEKLKKNAAVMSKGSLAKARLALQKQAQELQTKQMAYQRDLYQAQNQAMEKFANQVKAAAGAMAKKDNVDIILPANGLLFNSGKTDYTDEVIAKMKKSA